jgi:toxin FitB
LTPDEESKFKLLVHNSILHDIDKQIIEKTIILRKIYRIKLPDAIIAATCLVHDLILITRNSIDFSKIAGLEVFDPATTP